MKINPRGKTLFLKREETAQKKGALFVPASARATHYVVAFAGPDADVEVGTAVVPSAKESGKITVEGTEYIVTDSDKLFATLEKEEPEAK